MASRASRRLVPQEPAAEQEASDGAGLPEADALSTDDSCDTARRSSSAVSRAPRSPHAGDKRPGTDAADDAVERIEGIVGGYHITDGACENALQPCDSTPRDTKVSVALIARPAERPDLPSDLPGAPKRQKDEAQALQQLARRIRTFPKGKYQPSPPPNLLGKLTDALILRANDVVNSVAAEAPALSGNMTYRLLAWTVADARGAQEVIDKPLALTIGKRLKAQAQRVRDDDMPYCRLIRERASQERQQLREGPMRTSHALAALEAALAESQTKEANELQQAKEKEIYIGFNELESLLTEEQRWDDASIEQQVAWSLADARAAELAADVPAPAIPAPSTAHRADFDPEVAMKAHFAAVGVYFPWALSEDVEPPDSIPVDLRTALGDEASQALEDFTDGARVSCPERWWDSVLPNFVKRLLRALRLEEQLYREVTEREEKAETERNEQRTELWAAEHKIEELHTQLREAKAREAALWEVIERCRWS
jgi:hypothetical protein